MDGREDASQEQQHGAGARLSRSARASLGRTPKGGVAARDHGEMLTLLDVCVSSLRRGHANIVCIVQSLTDDPRRESWMSCADCAHQVFLAQITPVSLHLPAQKLRYTDIVHYKCYITNKFRERKNTYFNMASTSSGSPPGAKLGAIAWRILQHFAETPISHSVRTTGIRLLPRRAMPSWNDSSGSKTWLGKSKELSRAPWRILQYALEGEVFESCRVERLQSGYNDNVDNNDKNNNNNNNNNNNTYEY